MSWGKPIRHALVISIYALAAVTFGLIALGEMDGSSDFTGPAEPIFVAGAVFCAAVVVTEFMASRRSQNRSGFDVLPPKQEGK